MDQGAKPAPVTGDARRATRLQRLTAATQQLDRAALALLRPSPRAVRWRLEQEAPPPPAPDRFALPRPLHCDWNWRPAPWAEASQPGTASRLAPGSRISPSVTLHHDDPENRAGHAVRAQPEGPAPFAVQLSAPGFSGSFLSLAVELPEEARIGLRQTHLLGLHLAVSAPARLNARINIRHGPNMAQLVRSIPPDLQNPSGSLVEFDLVLCPFDAACVAQIWCDLIFEGASADGVALHDLAFTRRPRSTI